MQRNALDVVVIGAGPAGETVAGRLADGGKSVAIVERELVGGECSYWGCIPSKVLIRPGDVLAAARRVPGATAAVTGDIDVTATFALRDRFTGNWDDTGALPWLQDRGIEVIRGAARIAGDREVEVEAATGERRRLSAREAVVLAVGTVAALPPIPGLDTVRPWTNRDITAAVAVPRRLLVLGGGAIGLEMAQAFRRLGADSVTVIEALPNLLAHEEPFAGEEVGAALIAEGITLHLASTVTQVRRNSDREVRLVLEDGSGLTGDELLVAAGRRPSTTGLGLASVGLSEGNYLDVDDQLRVTAIEGGWMYAVGDCNGRSLLTHMGKYQARVAADVILGKGGADRSSDRNVPRVTFTDPQVCAVGLTEAQARQSGLHVTTVQYPTGDVAGASVMATGFPGTSQFVIDEARRCLVGATFVGSGVQELLHAATIAIAGEMTLEHLWHAVPAFPTVSEVWLRLLERYGL